jgi:hypothetical protein
MIDPNRDPGQPWRGALVAGIAIVLLVTHLLLGLAHAVHFFHPQEILRCSDPLECLFD